MRRKAVISRLTTFVLATLGCLVLALLAPIFLTQRAIDEPFLGYAVMASPRDIHVVTSPIRLSEAPDLTLTRGSLYADGNAVIGTPISRFVLDGAVFNLNASGLRAIAPSLEAGPEGVGAAFLAPLVEQLMAMGYDVLIVRRGTLVITASDGTHETLGDVQAELTGRRKGLIAAKGSFMVRGQRLSFDTTLTPPADKRAPARWAMKASLKGDLLEAAFDGHLDATEDVQLSGQAEIKSRSLRRVARWFGVPIPNAEGLNAAAVKGQMNWARRTVAVENAKVTIDGSEATGALVLNLAGERPLIDGTLAFSGLDLTPYVEAARAQSFVFDRQTASWSVFDLSFPLITHVDADLRISAPKVVLMNYGLGRGAATISVRSGKLLAELAELELHSGVVSGQFTANANDLVPRYALRGKVENFEAGPAGASLFGAPVLSGRSTLQIDVASAGQTPALAGKATITMPEGGKLPLDLKAVRAAAKADGPPGWGQMAKGQVGLEQIEAKALIKDGVLVAETVLARSGATGLGATGRIDLTEQTLDLRLCRPTARSNPPTSLTARPSPCAAPGTLRSCAPKRPGSSGKRLRQPRGASKPPAF
jgi:AsmA protein